MVDQPVGYGVNLVCEPGGYKQQAPSDIPSSTTPAITGGGPKPEETCSSWINLRLSLG